jgi:hypothetical protein
VIIFDGKYHCESDDIMVKIISGGKTKTVNILRFLLFIITLAHQRNILTKKKKSIKLDSFRKQTYLHGLQIQDIITPNMNIVLC